MHQIFTEGPDIARFQRSICWSLIIAEACRSTTAARAGAAACTIYALLEFAPKVAPILLGAN